MPGLSRHLKQLEKELLALGEETMLIEELDGFIAGLLVCPDLISPANGFQSSGVRTAPVRSLPLTISTTSTGYWGCSWSITMMSRAR
jgi:uncharacterized protein